ncbi:MAG: superoxide dismutase family protein [Nitrospirota bacterium]
MKKGLTLFFIAFVILPVFIGGLSPSLSTSAYGQEKSQMAIARLFDAKDNKVGVTTLTEGQNGVIIVLQVYDLPPGYHGLHIHEKGKCEPPDYKSSGGHFNPYGREHGLKNPKGPHAGDLPNLLVGPDGKGAAVLIAPLVTLGPGENSLFRENGTAIMIHDRPDDHMTHEHSGYAGGKIACGVITKY